MNNQVLPAKDNALVADFMLYPQITITQIDVTIQTEGKPASAYTIYRDVTATKKIIPEQGKVYVFNVSFLLKQWLLVIQLNLGKYREKQVLI